MAGERPEHKIIRTNRLRIIERVSTVAGQDSAGWFESALIERGFVIKVGFVESTHKVHSLFDAVQSKIKNSENPKEEFESFLNLLRIHPPLHDLAQKLSKDYGELFRVFFS